MSDLREGDFGRVVAETVPTKARGSLEESLGYVYGEFLMQNSFALPALVIGFIAFPGTVVFIAYLWVLGALVTSPLRLWSKARTRQTDLRKRKGRNSDKKDLSVRRPLPLLGAGWVLKLTGAVVILGGFYFAAFFDLHDAAFSIAGYTRATPGQTRPVILMIGASLIYFGHRLARRNGRRALAGDQRAPIVYLRPFAIDGRYNFNPSGLLAQILGFAPFGLLRAFGPLGNINPLRLARLFFGRAGEHSEEQMAQFFRRYGPFVAIGKPGQLIPQTGALRLFVDDTEWKLTADELLSRAGMVVLQPSNSEGIRWEIERTLTTVLPQKVLLCLQLFDGRQGPYDQFRIWVEERTGIKLPRSLSDAMFIFFDGHRQARCLRLRQHNPVFWPISGCAINFKRTLAPFLASLSEGPSHEQVRPAARWSQALWSITAVLIWSFVLTLPWLLVDRWNVDLRSDGVKTLHDSRDHQWAWQLSSLWRPAQHKNSDYAAEFVRMDDGVECVIALMTLEKAEPITPEGFMDAAQANLQRKFSGLTRISRRKISRGELEWLETEYSVTSPGNERYLIARAAILERKVLFILGTYTETDHRESESLHRHTVEALDGFLWKTTTAQTALTTPTAVR
jgi:hypothetical protein